jgi:hypothetical protein
MADGVLEIIVLKITMHSNGKCTQMANALLTTTMFVQL